MTSAEELGHRIALARSLLGHAPAGVPLLWVAEVLAALNGASIGELAEARNLLQRTRNSGAVCNNGGAQTEPAFAVNVGGLLTTRPVVAEERLYGT